MLGAMVKITPADGSGVRWISSRNVFRVIDDGTNRVVIPPPGSSEKKYVVTETAAALNAGPEGMGGNLVALGTDTDGSGYDLYFNRAYIDRIVANGSASTIVMEGGYSYNTDQVFANLANTVNDLGTAISIAGTQISVGTATPEGAVVGAVGDLFLRTDGGANTTLYVKESGTGNTGWAAI